MKKAVILAAMVVITGALGMIFIASADDTKLPPDPETMVDAPPPFYQDEAAPDPEPPFSRFEWMKEELGLSQEQLDKLESLRLEQWKGQIELGAKVKIASLELAELLKTRGNDDAVLKKSAELTGLRNQMADLMIKHQLARRAIFTDEQWAKVSTFMRGAGYMRMHDGGRGMRPGMRFRQNDRFDRRYPDSRPHFGRRMEE
jgi:Spy/CpxP family protein refolding chaperone